MRFESDNAAGVHPQVLQAMVTAADAPGTYDGDGFSLRLDQAFTAMFEREVTTIWVTTGTAANALALGTLCPAYGGVLCHEDSHINIDECGAVGFFAGGATLIPLPGGGAKLVAGDLRAILINRAIDQHTLPGRCLSISNVTECGLIYHPAELSELGEVCREFGLRFHVDGARFANAVAASGSTPAALSWHAGVDILSFGFSKNGALMAEAMVVFDPALVSELRYRRKRAGHLPAKGRIIAAQLLAMLEGDLWLNNARASNTSAALIGAAAAPRLIHPVEANEIFLWLSADEAETLRALGFGFNAWRGDADSGVYRFVTKWDHRAVDVECLVRALGAITAVGA